MQMMLSRMLLYLLAMKGTLPVRESFYPFPEHLSPECDPPNVKPDTQEEMENITKAMWMKTKLYELESVKIAESDKIEIAKEVLSLLDDDIMNTLSHNIMAGGLLDDWNFDI